MKKLIIPFGTIVQNSQVILMDLLKANGFDINKPIIQHHSIESLTNTYEQEGD